MDRPGADGREEDPVDLASEQILDRRASAVVFERRVDHQDHLAVFPRHIVGRRHHGPRVGLHPDVVRDESDGRRSAVAQALGGAVKSVVELGDGGEDLLLGDIANAICLVSEHERDGGGGDARGAKGFAFSQLGGLAAPALVLYAGAAPSV